MKVFVAGASGVIGRSLVPRLFAAGHDVVAMARDEASAGRFSESGVTAVTADAHDAHAVTRAVAEAAPDAIISQLTALPDRLNPRRLGEFYSANDAVRRNGNTNLIAAARAAGVPRFIVQSAGYWYVPDGTHLRSEKDPFFVDAAGAIGDAVRTMLEVEQMVLGTPGIDGVALRYGTFYGAGTWYDRDGDIGRRARSRAYPIIGSGSYVTSFVHVDDAASATIAALDAEPGPYNVADDDPAPAREWLPAYAAALGARRPLRVPALVARLAIGAPLTQWTLSQRGISNARLKSELDWRPRFSSWREGFAAELGGTRASAS